MRVKVGDVAAILLPGGGYGAIQVSGVTDDLVTAYSLDFIGDERPSLASLAGAGPMIKDHYSHGGGPDIINIRVDDAQPPGLEWLGSQPVREGVPATSNAFSGWFALAIGIRGHHRWHHGLTEQERAAYKNPRRGHIDVDFGAARLTLPGPTGQLDLTGLPETGGIDWSGLDALPRVTTVIWRGPDRGLVEALRHRAIIYGLHWHDPPSTVDLSGTRLESLELYGDPVEDLRLPDSLHRLRIGSPARATTRGTARATMQATPRVTTPGMTRETTPGMTRETTPGITRETTPGTTPVTARETTPETARETTPGTTRETTRVTAREDGRWIWLCLDGPELPAGLGGVRDLTWQVAGEADAAILRHLPALETLAIHWSKPPGALLHPEAFTGPTSLKTLKFFNGYGVSAAEIPELPNLRHLEVDGLPRSTAKQFKARFPFVRVYGAKADAWIAANIENPLRDWVDDNERAGRAACKAYAKALKAIGTPEPALRTFVDELNAIDEKYEIIDTLRREQAGDVFMELARRGGVDEDTASDWFDDWRDF